MITRKRKYEAWGKSLKKQREIRFRSAREFCSQMRIGISYAQYSRYESGEQLPSLDQALTLCRALGVPTVKGLVEWSLAQVKDPVLRAEIEQITAVTRDDAPVVRGGVGIFTQAAVPLDDVIVFNRSHLKLFRSHPFYRDIFTYINSFAPDWVGVDEISTALGLPHSQVEFMLESLQNLGVVTLEEGKCRAAKRNFYFPDDEDFFELRNMNLTHNATLIMKRLRQQDLQERKAYRGLVTRELTSKQLDTVISRFDRLMSDVVGLPETDKPERIYSMCVLLGERFARPKSILQNPKEVG